MMFMLISVIMLTAASTAQYVGYQAPNMQTQPPINEVLRVPNYVQESQIPQLSYSLELPREEPSKVQFFNPEISVELKPPSNYYSSVPNYYEYAMPSQELQPPSAVAWNPSNNQIFYYNSQEIQEQDTPTVVHPKKFNKLIHEKPKQYQNHPKTIDEPILFEHSSAVRKMIEKFVKRRNQKELQSEKVSKKITNEPVQSASIISETNDKQTFDQGLSRAITDSLGIYLAPGERLDFHMQGHKGPDSYKWGFDTGKGHNRQFRFEEKDENGHVRGQYGYYDKTGKLNIFHYDAHPDGGFNMKSNDDDQ